MMAQSICKLIEPRAHVTMEPPSKTETAVLDEDQKNGSSFMSLCLAATNRLLVEKNDIPPLDGQDTGNSISLIPVLDPFDPMDNVTCYERLNDNYQDKHEQSVDIVVATKKLKQVPVRKVIPTKGRRFVSGIRAGSKRDDQWNIMFVRLQDFKFENGNCNVPQGYSIDPELATWVKNQRQAYRYMLERKTTKRISPERVTRLNHIGFEWRKYNKSEEEQARLRYNTKRQIQYVPAPQHQRIAMTPNHIPPHAPYTHHPHHRPPYPPLPPVAPQRIPPAGKLPYKPPPVTRPAPLSKTHLTSPLLSPARIMQFGSETQGMSTSSTTAV